MPNGGATGRLYGGPVHPHGSSQKQPLALATSKVRVVTLLLKLDRVNADTITPARPGPLLSQCHIPKRHTRKMAKHHLSIQCLMAQPKLIATGLRPLLPFSAPRSTCFGNAPTQAPTPRWAHPRLPLPRTEA